MAIDKVSNCKYLGHCINDKLVDDYDMARGLCKVKKIPKIQKKIG